ncbi:MAG: Cupin 2 conserved barrel domain protein [Thermoleophilia bacterium]|nr:Cupin 2 conserved barrel domain protein [Thermoleophilia bacterium]
MTASGEGWAQVHIDELGSGPGIRKVRAAAGITAFGMNVMVVRPRTQNRWHFHDTQQEVYFVHAGVLTLDLPEGPIKVPAGGVARVDAATPRRIANHAGEELVLVALGGHDGYVGRDGNLTAEELAAVAAGGALGGLPLD